MFRILLIFIYGCQTWKQPDANRGVHYMHAHEREDCGWGLSRRIPEEHCDVRDKGKDEYNDGYLPVQVDRTVAVASYYREDDDCGTHSDDGECNEVNPPQIVERGRNGEQNHCYLSKYSVGNHRHGDHQWSHPPQAR
jgi:hypothetical protein